jgi:hypothetical protein
VFLPARRWQAQLSYQYGNADDFFVGDQRDDSQAPVPGIPPHRIVSLINLDVLYGVSDRLSLDLTVPFAIGGAKVALASADAPAGYQVYDYRASGLGDVTLQAEYWLSDPAKPTRVTGSVGLGFKAPTGNDNVEKDQPGLGNSPIDESAQLGTGGWEIILRAQGTAHLEGPLYAYASGYYGLTLEEHTGVLNFGVLRSVPDTYSGRIGAAYLLPWAGEFALSLGGRINGVTVRDVIGGGDLYWRRPGYVVYVEPGLTWTIGDNMASLSVPIRAYANKLDSPLDVSMNQKIGASFASYLLLASYARRF